MCNPQDQGPSHVNWVGKKPAKGRGTGQSSKSKEKKEEGKSSYGVCYRCGRQGHFAKDVNCPARNKICNKCKQTGHFANCCKTKSQQNTSNPSSKDVRQVTEQADYPFTVTTTDKEIPKIDIVIGGVRLEGVLLDSGSTCNDIDREACEKLRGKGSFARQRSLKESCLHMVQRNPSILLVSLKQNFAIKIRK